jgi:hypothetical protein
MSEQTIEEVKKIIKEAWETTRKLSVTEYKNSRGNTYNYELEMIGHDGYLEMIKNCLKLLEEDAYEKIDSKRVSQEDFERALQQLEVSWKKSLNGEHKRPAAKVTDVEKKTGYVKDEDDHVNIRNMRVISKVVVDYSNPDAPKVRSDTKPVIRAKNFIREQSPLKDFLGNLRFEDGKFKRIAVLK